jgi:type I site-specific restriction-modification system R (restriction) subunit
MPSAIVAFSGDKEYNGKTLNESSINGFPSSQITAKFKEEPYRFLIVADKFQTGYDEPLLHTMYVDKILTDIKAVQTLSRLNRACPDKADTCVIDFANDAQTIQESFEPYYRTTILSQETDPDKLNDLVTTLEAFNVYTEEQVNTVVKSFLKGEPRTKLDPILDTCAEDYKRLNEDEQVKFKGGAAAEPEVDYLTTIIQQFNDLFGNLSDWGDKDNVIHQILGIRDMVTKDKKYLNAMQNSDKQNAEIEYNNATENAVYDSTSNSIEIQKKYSDDPMFAQWLNKKMFEYTYKTR